MWGDNGQFALEKSHVCLINANTVGTEILKSLVLPGIRAFTIIDDHLVTKNDFYGNFFVCVEGSIGQPRGKVASQVLLEMNEDVKKGDFVPEHFETLLDKNKNYFLNFTLVIACDIDNERSVNKLSEAMWSLDIPLLIVKSIGFIGSIRLQIREHAIIEAHPDSQLEDLRLDHPFEELVTFLDSFPPFEKMDRYDLSHIPSLVVINSALLKWREKNNLSSNDIPTSYVQKKQLKQIIDDYKEFLKEKISLEKVEGDLSVELNLDLSNFDEAIKMVNTVFSDSMRIPSNLALILSDSKSDDSQSPFWVMVRALKKFIQLYNRLPVRGTIPDMSSSSEYYVALQKVYKNKSKEDMDLMREIIQQDSECSRIVSEQSLHVFCKNIHYLTVINTSRVCDELNTDASKELLTRMQNETEEFNADFDQLRFYLLFKCVDRFYSKNNRYPGQFEQIEADIAELKVGFFL